MKNIWIMLDDLINRHSAPIPPEKSDSIIQIRFDPAPPNYDKAAEMDRLQALRSEYMEISDLIESELKRIQAEYNDPNTSLSRRNAIDRRRLVLYNKRAGNTGKIQAIDRKIEMLYNDMNGGL